jgi:hypothetical protein
VLRAAAGHGRARCCWRQLGAVLRVAAGRGWRSGGRGGGGAVAAPSIGRATAALPAGAPRARSVVDLISLSCSGEEEEGGAGFYTPPLVPAGGFNRD